MQAVIMAGGKGTRLATVTKNIPKPMVPIEGKPLLEYQIKNLKENGVDNIILIVGHLGDVIQEHFGDGSKFGVSISYYVEETPLGTAGALAKIKDRLENTFFLVFGDLFININYDRFLDFHEAHNALISLFAREGNGWSYKHARRQWSLMKADYLKYHFLNDFDEAMIKLIREYPVMQDLYGWQLNMDEQNHTIVEKKGGLVFVFNFHPTACIADYKFYIPEPGVYKIILNSDDLKFGGFGRLDPNQEFFAMPKDGHYELSIYNVNRTVLVLKKVRD